MDVDQLKGFYFAAKLKSFTEAASKLYLTQPAISLQVKALEREVGEKLFERAGRTVRLTHAGQVLYEQAEGLVGKLDEIEQVVRSLKSLDRGRLVLGASDTASMYFLPGLLRTFRNAYPKVEVVIESQFSRSVARKLVDRELDVGIVTLPHEDPRLEVVPLFTQKLLCIVPEDHPFTRSKAVATSDLVAEPLILLGKESHTRSRIDEYLTRANLPLRVAMELSNFEIIKHYVAHGLGVSLVPERAVAHLLPGLAALPLKQKLTIGVGAIYRRERLLSHPATVFLQMARQYFSPATEPLEATAGPERN